MESLARSASEIRIIKAFVPSGAARILRTARTIAKGC